MTSDARLRTLTERLKTAETRVQTLQQEVAAVDARVSRIETVLTRVLLDFANERNASVEDLVGEEGLALCRTSDITDQELTPDETVGLNTGNELETEVEDDPYTRHI